MQVKKGTLSFANYISLKMKQKKIYVLIELGDAKITCQIQSFYT